MKKYLKPCFFDEFSCVAKKCRYTCCASWDIPVDDVTAKKYKELNIKLTDKKHMPLDENGRCSALREDGYCDIVCKYGEKCLSYTCDFFPRTAVENDEYIELCLDNGCQGVLEMLMEQKGHTFFLDCDTYEKNIILDKISDKKNYYIRDFVIDLLQVEGYSLWTKLFAAYKFIEKNYDKIFSVVKDNAERYYDSSYLSSVLEAINNVDLDFAVAISYKGDMLVKTSGDTKSDIIYNKHIYRIVNYINEAEIKTIMGSWDEYNKCMHKYDYYFENYVVNSVYKNMVPSDNREKIKNNCEVILLEISMLYFSCYIYWIMNEKNISRETIIDISGYYARIMEHNKIFCSEFINRQRKHGNISAGVFYMLLKA